MTHETIRMVVLGMNEGYMHTDEPVGRAMLYVESTVAPHALEDFSNWCNSIHHFDTMRIEGFLSLRRFELMDAWMAPNTKRYEILTFYQVADCTAADFTTPAYLQHTATYVRPPESVDGNIEFERSIYERSEVPAGKTQKVGNAMITIRNYQAGANGQRPCLRIPMGDILSAYGIRDERMSGLVINCGEFQEARRIYEDILNDEAGIDNSTIQLFRQIFPARGVLLRDRKFRE